MKKPYESIRIFKNPLLERFTHVHPITPLIVWVPVVAFCVYRAWAISRLSPYSIGGLAAFGFFIWTLTEYLLHRFVFHFNAQGPMQEKLQYLLHGLHHDDPVDPTRLVMPPVAAVIFCVILYSFYRLILGEVLIDAFFAGFLVGYLCYDYIHYSVHHFTPKTRIGKFLKQSHMQHHFVSPHSRWGVSSPFWDYVFGTLEEVKRVRHGS